VTWRKTKEAKKAPPEYYLNWYVRSQKGLEALFKLLSVANDDAHFYEHAKLSLQDVLEALDSLTCNDVALTSSDALSVVSQSNASEILREISSRSATLKTHLQLIPAATPLYDTLNIRAIKLAEELGLPTLVTYPTFYRSGEADFQEIMGAVSRNVKVSDPWHYSQHLRDFHPYSDRQLIDLVQKTVTRLKARGCSNAGSMFKAGLLETERFADAVTFEWSKAPVSLPVMAADENATLVAACKVGWAQRFSGDPVFGYVPSGPDLVNKYLPRLKYELKVLKDLNFAGYFLLVQDIVQWSKKNGIAVGPGRGSVGGSLVAFLLGITECDPIRFGLLFERFINPGRLDLPDADLDFMSERRGDVIAYITDKWGADKVAGISNYGVLRGASAIRDVSRVFGLPESYYGCSKFVPKEHGQPVDLDVAVEKVAEIAKFRDSNPQLWKVIAGLESKMRSYGRHAAGIVVSGVPLTERAVVERRSGEPTVNWDKRVVEEQGLVKMDILGLSTLDLMVKACDYIWRRHTKRIDLNTIPLDDPKVLKAFADAKTTGVFQFEGAGMKKMLRELGRGSGLTFEEIAAVTALYRPGPMDTEEHLRFIDLKHGLEVVSYDHPKMEAALADTYGVMTYQEQVMQLTRDLAGFTFTEADNVRKAMGKKDKDKMASIQPKFVEGCATHSAIHEELANTIWEKMVTFAGYGFNKSHAIEYTLISYQSMWLKVNYPVEFFAAALTILKEEKLEGLVADAAGHGITIVPPDINNSSGEFEILNDTLLAIPFNRCKGISDNTTNAILAARAAGPFTSKADFLARVEKRKCNVKHQDILERVGAFSRIEPHTLPALHDDRLVDQRELLPGLVSTVLPVSRDMDIDKHARDLLSELCNEIADKHCTEGIICKPSLVGAKPKPKFVVITDCPTWAEEAEGQIGTGQTFGYISEALDEAGLVRADAYWTALLKRKKEGKVVEPEEINTYLPYLKRELEILKPPLILALGSSIAKLFMPDIKGNVIEFAGRAVYSKEMDCNIICGFNPAQIAFDADKQDLLNAVFQRVAELIP
jgi:DNA polymerase-3 subunit alpha